LTPTKNGKRGVGKKVTPMFLLRVRGVDHQPHVELLLFLSLSTRVVYSVSTVQHNCKRYIFIGWETSA
jgi:hypothetical protein